MSKHISLRPPTPATRSVVETVLPRGARIHYRDSLDRIYQSADGRIRSLLSIIVSSYKTQAVAAFNAAAFVAQTLIIMFCFAPASLPTALGMAVAVALGPLVLRAAYTYGSDQHGSKWTNSLDSAMDAVTAVWCLLFAEVVMLTVAPSMAVPVPAFYHGAGLCLPSVATLQMVFRKRSRHNVSSEAKATSSDGVFVKTCILNFLWIQACSLTIHTNPTFLPGWIPFHESLSTLIPSQAFILWVRVQQNALARRDKIETMETNWQKKRKMRRREILLKGLKKGEPMYWGYIGFQVFFFLWMAIPLGRALWPWLAGGPVVVDYYRIAFNVTNLVTVMWSWNYLKETNRVAAEIMQRDIDSMKNRPPIKMRIRIKRFVQKVVQGAIAFASLSGRALVALTLTIGYMALGLALVAPFFYLGHFLARLSADGQSSFARYCEALGMAVFAFWTPLWRREKPRGVRIESSQHPKLFETVKKVAERVGARMPDEIHVTRDFNAAVTWGGFRKRIMTIGLPLFQVHSISQLEAVLAHEFGHLQAGDVYFEAWSCRMQQAIESSIRTLTIGRPPHPHPIQWKPELLQFPFVWYGRLFLWATTFVSRHQEFAADRVAAKAIGSEHLAAATHIQERYAATYEHYLHTDVLPAASLGFRPGFLKGIPLCFRVAAKQTKAPDPRDPPASSARLPFAERIAAIRNIPASGIRHDSQAVSLLNNVADVETGLLSLDADLPAGETLKPVSWAETGKRVIVPFWRQMCRENNQLLRGLTLGSLPAAAAQIDALVETINYDYRCPHDAAVATAKDILTAALGRALIDAGWEIEHAPGFVSVRRGDTTIHPRDCVQQMVSGQLTEDDWHETLMRLRLGTAMALDYADVVERNTPAVQSGKCPEGAGL